MALQAGDLVAAEHFASHSLSLYPKHATALAILSMVCFKRSNFEQAAEFMRQSLDILPGVAERWMSYSVALKNCRQESEALSAINTALKLEPNSKMALNNKATLLNELGKVDEAKAILARLIKSFPDYGRAYFNLASMHKFARGDDFGNLFINLNKNIVKNMKRKVDQRHAFFALGKYFEDLKEYAEAFQNFENGNGLSNQGINYSVGSDLERMEGLKKTFSKDSFWISNLKKPALDTSFPIFIVGMPRSGPALLSRYWHQAQRFTGLVN